MPPVLRADPMLPARASVTHFWNASSPVNGRLRVTSPGLARPGSRLRTYLPSGVFDFESTTSCSSLRPEISLIIEITMPSSSKPKLPTSAASKSGIAAMEVPSYSGELLGDRTGAAGQLGQPEDHEL